MPVTDAWRLQAGRRRSSSRVTEALKRLQGMGVRSFVYSNIERDGMLTGPDLDGRAVRCRGDRRQLRLFRRRRNARGSGGAGRVARAEVTGVIVGKAIYERRFDVGEAQRLLDKRPPPTAI